MILSNHLEILYHKLTDLLSFPRKKPEKNAVSQRRSDFKNLIPAEIQESAWESRPEPSVCSKAS